MAHSKALTIYTIMFEKTSETVAFDPASQCGISYHISFEVTEAPLREAYSNWTDCLMRCQSKS